MDKIAVLIPCYNESKTIRVWFSTKPSCRRRLFMYTIIIPQTIRMRSRGGGATVRYEYKQGKGNVIRRMLKLSEAGAI